MRTFGIIGRPLGHSFSRDYFTRKFAALGLSDQCRYLNFEIGDIGGLARVREDYPDLTGFNVTIPYKRDVLELLDFTSPEARAIGAVNCVRVAEGRLLGYNTDAHGFEVGLRQLLGDFFDVNFQPAHETLQHPLPPQGGAEGLPAEVQPPRALILGNGGASAAVQYVLGSLCIDFRVVSRHTSTTPSKGDTSPAAWGRRRTNELKLELNYSDLTPEIVAGHRLIVNTTPLGTYPNVDAKPDLPYDAIGEGHFLYDLVYNPSVTAFLHEGARRGAKTLNGLTMLEAQAEKNWEIWNT